MNTKKEMVTADEYRLVEDFIYWEATLADESRYEEWESLLTDDMMYWVPRGEGDWDGDKQVSIINDNRSRLATRLRQLKTGTRHSQNPPSPMRRLISNLRVERADEDAYRASANFVLYEMQVQSTRRLNVWPGKVVYGLRRQDDGLAMCSKTVTLVQGAAPIPTLSFII